MPFALAKSDIAGAVVVVVKDGRILAQRGYGFADVAKRRRVDPAATLFRPGSVGKLFTWTAVMQLVEQGKLDLDADVNRYLDFRIPPRAGKPITLRHLMTHTAGFEEQAKEIMGTDPGRVVPYQTMLKRWTPERVYREGSTPAYSNYGAALAGYIVERVAGEPYDDYIERHIFAPLGMARSTMRQPLPARFRPHMATGYSLASGKPTAFEFLGPAPAGSLTATGADMGRFMIAHLNGGSTDTGRILAPETMLLMHDSVTHPIPGLNGMALGFYEANINGRRVIGHGGDTSVFHSELQLFRNEGVGIFVSFNSTGREGGSSVLRTALFEDFADRYFPGPGDDRRADPATARAQAQQLAGTWSISRRSHSGFLAIVDLIGQVTVSIDSEGRLIVPFATGANGQPRRWTPVAPFLWRDPDSHAYFGARVENGVPVRIGVSDFAPVMVFDRTPWHRSSAWLRPMLLAGIAALLITVILWPVTALVRRRYGAALSFAGRERLAYRLVRIAAALALLAVLGWVVLLSAMLGDIGNLASPFDPALLAAQLFGWLAFVGGGAIAAWNVALALRGRRHWSAKLWSIVLLLAFLTLIWIGAVFRLLAIGTNY
ncbi:beta-lactamase family protein [Sphingomonas colocasiae]|uniref:Beta-lactamase family protein n=2 Tax=Sphingomonas colocasiae TaxID=1848973 RepID=A0ABS7PRU1_9SPHN|nr:beta-lactamase family protein [Sphingomonas colocasiae]